MIFLWVLSLGIYHYDPENKRQFIEYHYFSLKTIITLSISWVSDMSIAKEVQFNCMLFKKKKKKKKKKLFGT